MDAQGGGYCTADDVAGGEHRDIQTRLRNIIDADTVRAVTGRGPIRLPTFLELMCEDGFRGHEGSTRVFLGQGQVLRLRTWDTLDFDGWILDEDDARVAADKAQRWRLVEALETEILHWRNMADIGMTLPHKGASPRDTCIGNSNPAVSPGAHAEKAS